jgi:D-alanine--D-alanine ligase
MQKKRIGVFIGGASLEKEVSFNSGRTVCDHLDVNLYDVIPLFYGSDKKLYMLPWKFLHRGKISDFELIIKKACENISWYSLKNFIDFAYLALHGKDGEDGNMQALLSFLQIPYSGSDVLATAMTSMKSFYEDILEVNRMNTPNSLVLTYPFEEQSAVTFANQVEFPVVVKPCSEGSSIGVSVANNNEELKRSINDICQLNFKLKDSSIIIQKKIAGAEFSCILLQERDLSWISLEPTEIVHKNENYFFNYIDKYLPGASLKHTPARFERSVIDDIKTTCVEVAKILNAKGILRVDGFVTRDNKVIILEANSFPGSAPSSFAFIQAAHNGMTHSDLINHIIGQVIHINSPNKLDFKPAKRVEMINKKKIAVVFGGNNAEKEVSLESGRNVIYKLSKNKYDIFPLFLSKDLKFYNILNIQLVCDSTEEIYLSIDSSQEIKLDDISQFDFLFIALHGGIGENGTLQGILNFFNVPYNGSNVLASSLCMDKGKTNEYLKKLGFNVPRGMIVEKCNLGDISKNWKIFEEKLERTNIKFPLVVKPHNDGSSYGIRICHNRKDFLEALDEVLFDGRDKCMIEEYVDAMELTVGVFGNSEIVVMAPSHAVKKSKILSLEEKFLPGDGENITPAPLSTDDVEFVKTTIGSIYRNLSCSGYARIDCFFIPADKEKNIEKRFVFLECNTLPALTPATCIFHQAAELGMRPGEFIEKIVELGFEWHSEIKKLDNFKICSMKDKQAGVATK